MKKFTLLNSFSIKKILLLVFLLCLNTSFAQFFTSHYIAPSPWSYYSNANELVVATQSTTSVTVTVKKSDGTLVTTLTTVKGNPAVYRFSGNPISQDYLALNTTLSNAGLIITSTKPTSVNLRNVASDNIPGSQTTADSHIKGNASLTSFGNAGLGLSFRIGYYRSGTLGTFGVAEIQNQLPIYSVMAVSNGTQVTLNNAALVTLNAGESYLFQAANGSLVESSSAVVMNTGSKLDNPSACGDGTVDQIPPTTVLGKEYIIIRTLGTTLAEQTTIVATEANTSVTIAKFSATGVAAGSTTITLANAGSIYTFSNGDGSVPYSANRIVADKKVAVYSGSAQSCEVDISTVAPISACGGSYFVETSKFKKYDNTDLPYFGFVLIQSPTAVITVNGSNLETLTAPRRQLGSSGWYLVNFDNNQISNPNILSISSTSRLTVSIIQQGGGFSMSAFFSNFVEQPDPPVLVYTNESNCSNGKATLTTNPGFAPYQWYFNGNLISGATSNVYVANQNGAYTVAATLACGEIVQSPPVNVAVCTDLKIVKTVNTSSPDYLSNVTFVVTATNSGPNVASNVVVNDVLPSGYTLVSATPSSGTWTSPNWTIGTMNPNSSVTLTVIATVKSSGNYSNTACISAVNNDPDTSNNCSTATIIPKYPVINAVNDIMPSTNGTSGNTNVGNVLLSNPSSANTPDTLNSLAVSISQVNMTIVTPATPATNGAPVPSINISTGQVSVPANTPAGNYTITYQICDKNFPTNCDSATVIVPVSAAVIDAVNDIMASTNGASGNTNVGNVLLSNPASATTPDTLNGSAVTIAQVNMTVVTPATPLSNGALVPSIDIATGQVSVPAGTPAGSYTIVYQICQKLNPTNCDSATVIIPVSAAIIDAVNDVIAATNGTVGNPTAGNVLTTNGNGPDTLNGAPATTSSVTISVVTPATPATNGAPVPSINTTTGNIAIPANTPAGNYTITYQICEKLNTGNCDSATVIVPVSAAVIDAVNDTMASTNGASGNTNVGNVLLSNPTSATTPDTLNGSAVTIAQVNMTVVTPATPLSNGALVPSIDIATGQVSVPAGTPAGSYTIVYQICQKLNPTNCDSATVIIPVSAATIDAVNDVIAATNGTVGNPTAGNVLTTNGNGPDTLNGAPATTSSVTISVVTPATPATNGAPVPSINTTTGNIAIPANTPAGNYTITYQICEKLNTGNCDSATVIVPVSAAVIDAVNDTMASTNGASGNTNVGNVLLSNPASATTPDTLNGSAVTIAQVNMTVVTPATPLSNGALVPSIDIATGQVSVPAGTPAGSYTIVYQICQKLNPTNCDSATVIVPVSAAVIDAVNDTMASTNGASGNTNVGNVLLSNPASATTPDTLNGSAVTIAQVNMTVVTPATPLSNGALVPSIDIATGQVSVPAGTPAGSYTIVYQICQKLNPTNCDSATVIIPVSAATIDAVNDVIAATNGTVGNPTAGNVLTTNGNGPDTLNGAPATTSSVTISVVTPATPATNGAPVPSINTTTGNIAIPANTPAGNYTITYQICEKLNTGNCDSATVIVPVSAAVIDAVNDTMASTNGASGNTNVGNVLLSNPTSATTPDTLNGSAVTIAQVNMTVVTPATPLSNGALVPSIDIATGQVSVPAGTPAGSYTIVYQICQKLNPTNCDSATVIIPVSAATIDAVNDVIAPTNGTVGNPTAGNVLTTNGNGPDTLNGAPATTSSVTISVVTPATPATNGAPVPSINTTTGNIAIPANTPAGNYTITYQICEKLNTGNCDSATVIVPVSAAVIDAVNDTMASTNGASGNTNVGNVLLSNPASATTPDTLNGSAVTIAQVNMTVVTPATPLSNGALVPSIDIATGQVSVPAGTPAGSYTIVYQICQKLNPTNCDSATVIIPVSAATIDAVNDVIAATNGTVGNPTAGNVLTTNGNGPDTLNGAPATTSSVTISVVTPATPATNGAPVPSINTTTGNIAIPANTPAGNYTITYQICEKLNTGNCDSATVIVPVSAAVIDAVNDTMASTNGASGNTNVGNVLLSNPTSATTPDTLNGSAVTIAQVNMTVVTPATPLSNGALVPSIDIATGQVSVPAGTPAGSYTIVYQICQKLNPTNCDSATVIIPVSAATIDAVNDVIAATNGTVGNPTAGNVLTTNGNGPDTLNGAPATTSSVTISVVTPATPATNGAPVPSINTTTGNIAIPANTPAGNYTITYQICEKLNTGNCDSATVIVPVSAAVIDAVNDTMASTNGASGNTNVGNVLLSNPASATTPDTLNGSAVTIAQVNMTVVTPATPLSNGALVPSIDIATGQVSVPAGTPAGSYTIVYQICQKLNPTNCDSATVIIPVSAATIDAVNDVIAATNGTVGNPTAGNVLTTNGNGPDTLNGAPATTSSVTISVVTPATPATNGAPVPSINTTTGNIAIPANTPAGNYTITYQICEKLNTGNCDSATVIVPVSAAVIDAVNDIGNTIIAGIGGESYNNVLINDTLNNGPATINNVIISQISTTNIGVTIDSANGSVNVSPNTPGGNYTIVYQICEKLNPGNCDSATVTVFVQAATIKVTKDGTYVDTDNNGFANPGDTVTYTFVVTNTGNVPLTNVTITDNNATVTGGPIALAVGASNSTAFTATHTITQADIDAGYVYNLALVSGTPPSGPPVTGTSTDPTPCTTCPATTPVCPDCTVTVVPQTPSIKVTKDGTYVDTDNNGFANPGDTITYTFVVTNTGNVPLTNVTITDNNATVTGGPIALAVGASNSTAFTATHTITQADIDAGYVYNLALVSGTPPSGPPVTGTSTDPTPCTTCPATTPVCPDCTVTVVPQTPSIKVTKDGTYVDTDNNGFANPGDTVTYTFVVTNTGNVPLTNVTITDNNATVTGGPIALAVGASNSTAFTATHTITQADIDAGYVYNLALVSGTPPSGPPVTGTSTDPTPCTTCPATTPVCPDCTVTVVPQTPSIKVTKDGTYVDTDNNGFANPGDTITYTFVVTNTGNVPLTNVTITDNNATVTGGPIALAVGASNSTAFTATHTITQADIDAGYVYNLALVSGTPPSGPPVTGTSTDPTPCTTCPATTPVCPDCTVTVVPQTPSIKVTKDGTYVDTDNNGFANPGDTITYTFVVTNTGNVPLTNVTITDNNATVTGGPIALAVGASNSTAFTATHTITQADIDTGYVYNLALASGTPPSGPPVTGTSTDPTPCTTCPATTPVCPDCTVTVVPQTPSIKVTKDGTYVDTDNNGFANPGDTVTYTFVVTNTGNVPLTNVTITDNNATVTGGPIALAVGASNSTAFTATHTITQADIDAGYVYNLALASGTPPSGPPVTGTSTDPTPCTTCPATTPVCPDCTVTVVPQTPSIKVTKDGTYVDTDNNGFANPGDTVTYTFVITNTGNVPLTNVTITDNNATVTGGPIALAVGASNSTAFTATHTITQADIDTGYVYNLALASGTPPSGPPVTGTSTDPTPCTTCPATTPVCPDCTVTVVPQTPSIKVTKDGTYVDTDNNGFANPGDTVTYTFVVTNTGNVPLTNVTITDNNATVTGGPIALAVGASNSTAFTATHTITQADIDTGYVYNLALASGTPPSGPPVTGTSTDPTPCTTCPATTPVCPDCTVTQLINAINDNYTNIACDVTATAGNILINDTYGSIPVNSTAESQVTLSILSGNYPNITIAANGDVNLSTGIAVGTYTFTYQICSTTTANLCDQATVTVNVIDTTNPVFVETLPANITVECSDVPTAPTLTATDSCGSATVTFITNTTPGSCPGNYIITNTWTATDNSGNFITHVQTVTVQDTTPPTFVETLPTNVTVECSAVPTAPTLTATDNCGTATVAYTETTTAGSCSGSYILTRTWIATDLCGLTTTHVQTVTVQDTTPPTFVETLPTNVTVECSAVPTAPTLTATDNCGTATAAYTETTTAGSCSGSYILTRTWIATDLCGLTTTHVQTVTVQDTTPPTFVETLPTNVTVECSAVPTAPSLTATDNCGTATVAYTETTTAGSCSGSYILTRTWIATDLCGLTTTHVQTVTVQDTTPPTFVETLPTNVTVECSAVPTAPTLTATDNCGTATVAYTETTTAGSCSGSYTLTRTWIATDLCGLTTTHVQTVTVQDTTPPTFVETLPTNVTVECSAVPTAPTLTATDNCGTATVAYTETTTAGSCSGSYILTRTWIATDLCGLTTTHVQTVTVQDTTPPTFVETLPTNVTVECSAVPTAPTLTATDNCGTATVAYTETTTAGSCSGSYILTRTWIATDLCGLTTTHVQTVTVQDTTPPTFVETLPTNVTVECSAVPTAPTLTATDNCGTATVAYTETTTAGSCSGSYILTRTWIATDLCGLTTTHVQTVTVQDTTPPTFVETLPTNVTVECSAVPTAPTLTATDNCGTATVAYTETTTAGSCAGSYTLTRTWIATDLCGLTTTHVQTVTVQDTTPPTFVETLPTNVTVECSAVPTAPTLTATDNCGTATVAYTETTTAGSCAGSYTLTRTWIATDLCGLTTTHVQTVTVQDTTPPTFVETLPTNVTVECSAVPTAPTLTATDNCGTATVAYTETTTAGSCSGSYILTRTWIATDLCGLTTTHVQTVTVQDTTPPALVNQYSEIVNVNCDQIPVIPTLEFSDNCTSTASITVAYSEVISTQIDGTYVITRTWTATDSCGNSKTFTQTINVTVPNYLQETTIGAQCDIDTDLTVDVANIIALQYPGILLPSGSWTDVNNSGSLDNGTGIFTPFNLPNGNYVVRYDNNDPVCPRVIEVTIPVDRSVCTVESCASLIVHNAFTPNGDGINEYFVIENIDNTACYPENTVEVYNRWGIKVFDTNNYDNYDHVFRGISEGRSTVKQSAELPTGTYFYILKYKTIEGNFVTKNGYLYLSR